MRSDFIIKRFIQQIKEDFMTPKYKAEVPVDTFISPFMSDIINQYLYDNDQFREKIVEISKEFPLKNANNNTSKNIDFLFATRKTLLIVEFKTNSKSFDQNQLENYINVAEKIETSCTANFLLEDYEKILKKTTEKKKYKWQYENKIKPAINKLDNFTTINEVQIVYIAPTLMRNKIKNKDKRIKFISFEDLANLKLTQEFVDMDISQAWDEVKILFKEIEKLDVAI